MSELTGLRVSLDEYRQRVDDAVGNYAAVCRITSDADRESRVEAWRKYTRALTNFMKAVQARRAAPDEASRAPAPQEGESSVPQHIVDAITAYGDARADNGSSDLCLGNCIRLIRAFAARAPAPISDERIIEIAIATKSAEPGRDGYVLPITFARAVLAQSQGGQPATSREQGADARQVEYEVHGLLADGESIMQYASSTDLAEALNYARGYDADGEIVQVFEVTRRPIGGDYERWQRLTGITPATEGAKP